MSGSGRQPVDALVEHLFRHQWGATVSRLSVRFGIRHLNAIEDSVQDALMAALRVWPLKGVPSNPGAWIFTAARNRLIDTLRHLRYAESHVPELSVAGSEAAPGYAAEIADGELAMICACCHPQLPKEGQIALTLKLVCGLSTREIAAAFVTEEATIAQRIHRAKTRLGEISPEIEVPGTRQLDERLDSVLSVIYLLFNEGYSAHGHENLVRFELCAEALRLTRILIAQGNSERPTVRALAALICLQSARLPARTDRQNELVLLANQDRTLWDQQLIDEGMEHLRRAADGSELSRYHLEAGIAAAHAAAPSYEATDWQGIRFYYDQLCELYPSEVYELNRAIAVAEIEGPNSGLELLQRGSVAGKLERYYLYHATAAELSWRSGDRIRAIAGFEAALKLVASETERRFLARRLGEVRTGS